MSYKYVPDIAKPTNPNYKGPLPSRGKCKHPDCPASASPAGTGYCSGHDLERTPSGEQPKADPSLPAICIWTESVGGYSGKRIGDAVYYQLYVKKDPWWIKNATRGFIKRYVVKLIEETPDDYVYDPDPLYGTRNIHMDGEDQPVAITFVRRRPRDAAERKLLQTNVEKNVQWLFKQDCPHGCKAGYIVVSDYPDDPFLTRLEHTENCRCVYE